MKTFIPQFKLPLNWTHLFLAAIFTGIYSFYPNPFKEKRTISVAVDKMNVFYIGVDNPITVAVEGIANEKLHVHSDDVKLTALGGGKFNVTASRPGDAAILVTGEGFEPKELIFRVKRIPDPTIALGLKDDNTRMDGKIDVKDFKDAQGLKAILPYFEFDVDNFFVTEYSIVRVPKMGDPVEVMNRQGDFNEMARKIINSAEPGDTYYFETVKIKAPGDATPRQINSLVFKIQ